MVELAHARRVRACVRAVMGGVGTRVMMWMPRGGPSESSSANCLSGLGCGGLFGAAEAEVVFLVCGAGGSAAGRRAGGRSAGPAWASLAWRLCEVGGEFVDGFGDLAPADDFRVVRDGGRRRVRDRPK